MSFIKNRRVVMAWVPGMYVVKTLSIVIIILILASMFGASISVASSPIYSSSREDEDKYVKVNVTRVAEIIVSRVKNKVYFLLKLAKEQGIEFDENLSLRINKTIKLLAKASDLVDEEPLKAVKIAVLANEIFLPVAKYILSNIPDDVKRDIQRDHLDKIISQRLEVVALLKNRTLRLKSTLEIEALDDIMKLLDEAESILVEARDLLMEGNYSVKDIEKMIVEATKKIEEANRMMYRIAGGLWILASMTEKAIEKTMNCIRLIGRAINATIRSIENNDTARAYEILNATIVKTSKLYEYVSRALEIASEKVVGENNFTKALAILRDTLNNTLVHLYKALEYLSEEDSISAETELEKAFEELKTGVETAIPYIKSSYRQLEKLKECSERIRKEIREHWRRVAEKATASILMWLERMDIRLKIAYRLYKNGKISEENFTRILDRAEEVLLKLKDRLLNLPKTPELLIRKIDAILEWIQSVKPSQ